MFQRLKERKLVQWALAYVAGAWFVFELVTGVGEPWGLPDWTARVVTVGLAVGLLVTLVLAWYHGEQGRQKVSGPELLIIGGLLLVGGVLASRLLTEDVPAEGVTGQDAETPTVTASEPSRPAIAVLPFDNLSGREEDDAFVAGMHDELVAQLSRIRSLQVKALTAVLQYRDTEKLPSTIGAELGAHYIVEGGVQRADPQVQVRVSLVSAEDNERIWGDRYAPDLTVGNLLDIQSQIAVQLASRLGAEILPAERERLNVGAPENFTAYENYLDGLSDLRAIQRGDSDPTTYAGAIEALGAAIAAEPGWAPPRAALGTAYHWIASRGTDRERNYGRSKQLLDEAIELDSLYTPAWAALGFVSWNWSRDYEAAEAAYAKTPDGPPGITLLSWGRFDEAVAAYRRDAMEDPLSLTTQGQLGLALLCAGNSGEAVEQFRRRLDMGENVGYRWPLTYALFKADREQEGRQELQTLDDGGRLQPPEGALLYALAGDLERAESLLGQAEQMVYAEMGQLEVSAVAAAALTLGDAERALAYLESVAEQAPDRVGQFRCLEEVRTLEGDPRYGRILELAGFPSRD